MTAATLRRAFSLIELLVVIAIIAMLIGILLPALGSARAAARATACLANHHAVGQAVVMYHGDYNDYFPLSSHSVGSLAGPGAWIQSLAPYGVIDAARRCPADEHRRDKLTSYATNDHLEPLTAGIDYHPITGERLPGGRDRALTRFGQLPNPWATVYLAEPAGAGTQDHLHSIGWERPEQVGAAIAVDRHLGASNFLFTDGHAAPVTWSSIQARFSAERSMFNPETAH